MDNMKSQKIKRRRLLDQSSVNKKSRKWNHMENVKILEYLKQTIDMGLFIEKPNAKSYYTTMILKTGLIDCGTHLLRNKVRNFNTNYRIALKWINETGQGILASEGETAFENALRKRYQYFQFYEEIWGTNVNVHVPFVSIVETIGEPLTSETIYSNSIIEKSVKEIPISSESPELAEPNSQNESQSKAAIELASSIITSTPKCRTPSKLNVRTAKEVYAEISLLRNEQWKEKMNHLKAQQDLEREKFEFHKINQLDTNKLYRMELENRKLELEVEKMKWEVQLRKLSQI